MQNPAASRRLTRAEKQECVQAHLFVCFLAYVVWKTLEQWQQRAGLGNSPRTLLQELARIQSTDVVLPTADAPYRDIRIRCVVRPDKAQAYLLDRLGLRLPERLRYRDPPLECSANFGPSAPASASSATTGPSELRNLG